MDEGIDQPARLFFFDALLVCMAQQGAGLVGLGNLSRLTHAQSRSISPENHTGEKGKAGMALRGTGTIAAGDLGQGWKISPSIHIPPGKTVNLGDINNPGVIEHICMSLHANDRFAILRIYWDVELTPSVEVPVGNFFASGSGMEYPITSLPICVNPDSGLNSYLAMPFGKSARLTLETLEDTELVLFYQIDYALTPMPPNTGYFHAQFRRSNPLPFKTDHVTLDGVKGWGQYVGTYIAWGSHNGGWWGEGKVKFFIDGDEKFPTIAGTGTEDYFLGNRDFVSQKTHQYVEFSSPYSGMHIITSDSVESTQPRFSLYRWHLVDPIHFDRDLKVSIQAMGWQSNKYLPLQDDISSAAFWYQTGAVPDIPR